MPNGTGESWIGSFMTNIQGSILDPKANKQIIEHYVAERNRTRQITEEINYDRYLDSMRNSINMNSLSSIEGLPYQFLPNVDRRVLNSDDATTNINSVGRKYAEKIATRMPLLFLMPCTAKFMADSDDNYAAAMLSGTLASLKGTLSGESLDSVLQIMLGNDYSQEKSARYYGTEFAYDGYYNYLQVMLSTLAHYLGIEDKYIYYRGQTQKIANIDWSLQNTGVDDLAHYLSGAETIAFYMDGIDSISETFTNDTTTPSIASEFNSRGDDARQMRFLFGNKADRAALATGVKTVGGRIIEVGAGLANGDLSAIAETLEFAAEYLSAPLFQDLINNSSSTILQGGRLIFPEIWNDSSYSKSYNISIKLRSPDHDPVSIFLNIFVPYCKLLALTLPHTDASVNTTGAENDTNSYMNPNTYFAPYLVKAYSPGSINIDMGIIDSLSATKGATCQWSADGLPTQIDVDVSIKDLYHSMAMSAWGQDILSPNIGRIWAAVSNTAYMDYLANMAGLNVKDTHRRKVELASELILNRISNTGARLYTHLSNKVSNYVKAFYDW